MDELKLGFDEPKLPVKGKKRPGTPKKEEKKVVGKKVSGKAKPAVKAEGKAKRGRPTKENTRLSTSVSMKPEIYEKLAEKCGDRGRSAFIEKAIEIYLKILPLVKKDTTEIHVIANGIDRTIKL